MNILSPKSEFMGGALISAMHLGKLFPGQLLTFKKSKFLDNNHVEYRVTSPSDEVDDQYIWCNDICVDEGYYSNVRDKNQILVDYLKKFKVIYLVNHQPISRPEVREHFKWLFDQLTDKKITLLNYRSVWTYQWSQYGSISDHPNLSVQSLPYHYYLGDIVKSFRELTPWEDRQFMSSIGRMGSKCKIQSAIKDWIYTKPDVMEPDPMISTPKFRSKLSKYKFILTGYYYGGEGDPELTVRTKSYQNHLEWSFIDAMLSGCIPITSSLFSSEINKMFSHPDILPILDYDIHNVPPLKVFGTDLVNQEDLLNIQLAKIESYSLEDLNYMRSVNITQLVRTLVGGNYKIREIFDRVNFETF